MADPLPTAPAEPGPKKRIRRPAQLFDASGTPVVVRYPCTHCGRMKGLEAFGLRKMADGSLRSNTICGPCRGSYQAKPKTAEQTPPAEAPSLADTTSTTRGNHG